MSERQRELISINECWKKTDRLHAHITLPQWIDTEKIGVDVSRAILLMQLGGIKNTEFKMESGHQSKTNIPMVVGFNNHGVAYAGRASTKAEESSYHTSNVELDQSHVFRNSQWTNLKITLDRDAVQNKINEAKGDLRNPESWIPHIDKALRQNIRKAGTKHLLLNHTKFQTLSALWVNLNESLMDAGDMDILSPLFNDFHPHVPSSEELASELIFNLAFWTIWGSIIYGKEKGGSGYRVSLLPGLEIDRASALQILSRTKSVVAKIKLS